MPDQIKHASRPWRRFLRFSVRGLIVIVLVIGLGLGWAVRTVRNARIQREAVVAIENANGFVCYDWQWNNGTDIRGGEPWAPRWLVDLIGVDYFGHVTDVRLHQPTDSQIAMVGHLTRLQRLVMNETSITNLGLANLRGLSELSVLDLGFTPVADAGLASFGGLRRLSELAICSAYVTDDGLVHLKNLTKLSKLELLHTKITDSGLVHLKGLTNLSFLDLRGARVTDAGFVGLKGLGGLSYVGD